MKQVNIKIPDALHADVKGQAKANYRSLNAEILSLLRAGTEDYHNAQAQEEADARVYGPDADDYLNAARPSFVDRNGNPRRPPRQFAESEVPL